MKCLRHFFSKFLKDKNGFTLVELMIGFGAMAGLVLVTMELTKQQKAQIVESQVEADVAQMKAKIQAILSTPQHCNANFHLKSGVQEGQPFFETEDYDGIQAIYKCDSSGVDACKPSQSVFQPSPGNRVAEIEVKSGDDWTNTGSASNRVRISSIGITITGVEDVSDDVCELTTNRCGNAVLPHEIFTTLAWVGVKFEKKYLNTTKSEKIFFSTPLKYSKQAKRPFGCVFAWQLMDDLPRMPTSP